MRSRPQVKSVQLGSSVEFVCSVANQDEHKVSHMVSITGCIATNSFKVTRNVFLVKVNGRGKIKRHPH